MHQPIVNTAGPACPSCQQSQDGKHRKHPSFTLPPEVSRQV